MINRSELIPYLQEHTNADYSQLLNIIELNSGKLLYSEKYDEIYVKYDTGVLEKIIYCFECGEVEGIIDYEQELTMNDDGEYEEEDTECEFSFYCSNCGYNF